jgi:secreted Zn-dependent insulinase-like peptidase
MTGMAPRLWDWPFDTGTHAPTELEARIEAFLTGFGPTLADMPAAEFEKHRASLLAAKLQKDRSLAEEADRHWSAIFDRRCGD